jgi:hypothetical protein
VAGVAQAFALNPLLGVGAVALGAAVLAGANAAFGGDDTQGERPDLFFPGGGTGSTAAQNQAAKQFERERNAALSGSSSFSSGSGLAAKAPTQTLIEQVSEANFLKSLRGTGNFDVAATVAGNQRGNVVINVNAPSVIDEEGFSRAVALALNNSNRRTGGGGSSLITQDVQ